MFEEGDEVGDCLFGGGGGGGEEEGFFEVEDGGEFGGGWVKGEVLLGWLRMMLEREG